MFSMLEREKYLDRDTRGKAVCLHKHHKQCTNTHCIS